MTCKLAANTPRISVSCTTIKQIYLYQLHSMASPSTPNQLSADPATWKVLKECWPYLDASKTEALPAIPHLKSQPESSSNRPDTIAPSDPARNESSEDATDTAFLWTRAATETASTSTQTTPADHEELHNRIAAALTSIYRFFIQIGRCRVEDISFAPHDPPLDVASCRAVGWSQTVIDFLQIIPWPKIDSVQLEWCSDALV